MPSREAAVNRNAGRHTLDVRIRDKPATVERVVGMLRHRRFDVESITVHSAVEGVSRITLILRAADPAVVLERLHRLVDVLDVSILESQTTTTQSSGEHDGKTVL